MKNQKRNSPGQAMVFVTIVIGAVMATAGVISGLLTYYELRQTNDMEESSMSFYAADAGMEKTLGCYFSAQSSNDLDEGCNFGGSVRPELSLLNGAVASTKLTCVDSSMNTVSCSNNDLVAGFVIKSFGSIRKTERVLQTFFATKRNE